MKNKGRSDRSEVSGQALRAAYGSTEPDLRRIKDAFPGMVAEAARIRASAASVDPLASIGLLARRMLPRLAAAAMLLAVAATIVGWRDVSAVQVADVEIDNLVLTGKIGDSVSDLLLEAVTEDGQDNG